MQVKLQSHRQVFKSWAADASKKSFLGQPAIFVNLLRYDEMTMFVDDSYIS